MKTRSPKQKSTSKVIRGPFTVLIVRRDDVEVDRDSRIHTASTGSSAVRLVGHCLPENANCGHPVANFFPALLAPSARKPLAKALRMLLALIES